MNRNLASVLPKVNPLAHLMEPNSRIAVIPDMSSSMRFINLKANVSEFGFFRSFAKSRPRLILSVFLVTLLTYGGTFATASYILETSSSVGLNLLLITLLMMVLLIMSYLQAVLIGDIFFTHHWRQRVILGEKTASSMKDHNAEFLIVVAALVVANTLCLNFVTQGFFDTYQKEGFFRSELRSETPEERESALVKLSAITNFELWENENLRLLVRSHYQDKSPLVRAQAAWNSGEMKDKSARKDLLLLVKNDTNKKVRIAAATSLGKLGNNPTARVEIEAQLDDADDDEIIGLLRALALMKSPLSGKKVWQYTRHKNQEVALYAYWVIRNGTPEGIREKVRSRLEEPRSAKEYCALLDTLKMVANKDDIAWARRKFQKEKKGERCEPFIWEDKNERIYYVLYSDSFRVKHMKIVANASGLSEREWFDRLIADTSQTWRVREVALEIVKQIDKAKKR